MMKRKVLQYSFKVILCILTVLGLSSCLKNNNIRWVYYAETYCADKWEFSNNNERLKNNIIEYMDGKGVKILEIEIFRINNGAGCVDCECLTGREVRCKIKRSDLRDAKKENFKEQ